MEQIILQLRPSLSLSILKFFWKHCEKSIPVYLDTNFEQMYGLAQHSAEMLSKDKIESF